MRPEPQIVTGAASADGSPNAIVIRLNGEEREIAPHQTVESLLAELGIHPGIVVVERNREILRRDSYGSTPIVSGDALELVHFVGGG